MTYLRKDYYLLRLLNYLLMIIYMVFLKVEHNSSFYLSFILLLIYIMNSQFRMFYLIHKKYFFIMSIIIEVLIGLCLYHFLGGFIFLYLFISILDLSLCLNKYYSILLIILIYILSCFLLMKHTTSYNNILTVLIINTLCIFSFAFIGIYSREERSKKLEAQELYDKLRISEDKLLEAYKELELYSNTIEELTLLRERTRVSRELHDSVGHSLSTLIIQLQAIQALIQKSPEAASNMLGEMVKFTKNSLENVRRTVRKLKPIEFEAYEGIFPIEELIKNFEKLTGINVKLILSKEKWKLNSSQSHNLYRIVQESLSNSLKHGHAKNIQVSIQFFQDKIYSQIKDDGMGCDAACPSFGLKGIKERVKELNGSVDFHTSKGKGFEIIITLPKQQEMNI